MALRYLYEKQQDDHIKTHSLRPSVGQQRRLAEFQEFIDETKLTDAQRAKICETKTMAIIVKNLSRLSMKSILKEMKKSKQNMMPSKKKSKTN